MERKGEMFVAFLKMARQPTKTLGEEDLGDSWQRTKTAGSHDSRRSMDRWMDSGGNQRSQQDSGGLDQRQSEGERGNRSNFFTFSGNVERLYHHEERRKLLGSAHLPRTQQGS